MIKTINEKSFQRVFAFTSILLILAILIPGQAAAQQSGIELITQFPSISANAGEDITFSIKVKNHGNSSEIVNLEVSSQPEEWMSALRGRGRNVQQVLVEGNGAESVDLLVKIPDTAKTGDYNLTVTGTSERGSRSNLPLTISVSDIRMGEDTLTARYAELKGPSDATYNFRLDLKNNGGNEQLYSLGAQIEPGWQISFTPTGESQQVASINVGPGESKGIDVKITPPATITEGTYNIYVEAASPTSIAEEELKIIISGTYNLDFTTASEALNAEVLAGGETKINMKVVNTGSTALNNVNFSSNQPKNWATTFEPDTIEVLEPGESHQITATIKADAKAIAGDYMVTMTASTREIKNSADLRVTVKTSTLWGIVGLLIVIGVIVGLYYVFRKYGRR